jgi:hypothetical protein
VQWPEPLLERRLAHAIGGVLGAGSGFLLGNVLQNNDIWEAHTEHQLGEQQREIEHQRREIHRLQQEES